MAKRAWAVLALLVALAAGGAIPREVELSPAWRLRVLDEGGRPVEATQVVQWWAHYSVDLVPHHEERETNAAGEVLFPMRTVRLRAWDEVRGAVAAIARTGINASLGPSAWLVVSDPRAPPVPRASASSTGEIVSVVVLHAPL
jgi:hypothetical protein